MFLLDIEVKLNALGMEADFSLLPEKIQNLISFAKERKVNETSSPPPMSVQWDWAFLSFPRRFTSCLIFGANGCSHCANFLWVGPSCD